MMEWTNKYGGQLLLKERQALYSWVKTYATNVLEIGTGSGGGGTYYMSLAVPNGMVYTCDPSREISEDFLQKHKNVQYFQLLSSELINYIIEHDINVDFIFFDGPEDPIIALNDFKQLENYVQIGTKFACHDWATEQRIYDNGYSTKALHLRPYLEANKNWKLINELKNSNESVGLCLYERI